jgi:adenine-specific DNA-methyltransferase
MATKKTTAKAKPAKTGSKSGSSGKQRKSKTRKAVDDYRHDEATRLNNPPAALAREDLAEVPSRKLDYDPHLPPELWWAGKDHSGALQVEAPSIHIHERLSAEAIIRAVQREDAQLDLFGDPGLDRSKAIEFYQHEMDWVNRLILGDSLVVMSSLLERERLGGRVQLIYVDPPYGINYNSNFQARISDHSPKETGDDALTREPEQIQAYRDMWELGIHSYLTYIRERLVAARDLLADTGSIFVQMGPDNVHLVRALLDEVFGPENAAPFITVQKTSGHDSKLLPEVCDYLLWYAKDKTKVKFHQLFERRAEASGAYRQVEMPDGSRRELTSEERSNLALLPDGARVFTYGDMTSQGSSRRFEFEFEGRVFRPGANAQWKIRREGLDGLAKAKRLGVVGNTLRYIRYLDDFGAVRRINVWTDTVRAGFARKKQFVVETNAKIIERVVAMCTDAGDLVLDPTCGSGTTAWACEKLGRRWITIDTSRVALAIARERVLTGKFDYYKLQDVDLGVDAGLEYETLTRITASSIGYGTDPETETLHDQPKLDRSKLRVSGPFTVEGLGRYAVDPFQPDGRESSAADEAADHVAVLLDALRTQGIPRQNGKPAEVVSLTPLSGGNVLHAEGAFRDADGSEEPFAVSLGPRHGPITPAQVDEALAEAPGYRLIAFAGFAATSEAQEYLATGKRGRIRVALLEANPDLLLGDLLKQTKSSQVFRLFSSPEVELREEDDGLTVELLGMDSFDAATGETVSRDRDQIAAWLLDTDYDGTAFHANQAFFTANNAWDALAKALRGSVDENALAKLQGFKSLPFERPASGKVAVRVIDDAGSTSERVLTLPAR